MQPMDEEVKLALRLPAEVHERIKRLAEMDRRSLNGEIIHILEQYADQREQANPEREALLAQLAEQMLRNPAIQSSRPRKAGARANEEAGTQK